MSNSSGKKMALAILAAGQSRRFGERDKLASLLGGKMLGLHVAEAFADSSFAQKLIVTTRDHPCAEAWSDLGYELLINDEAEDGQATSVQIVARFAQKVDIDALCICLADMPFVNASVVEQLVREFQRLDGKKIVVASNDKKTMPPAIFPARYFEKLGALHGDQGARSLLSEAKIIDVTDPILMDIDTIEDLRRAELLLTK